MPDRKYTDDPQVTAIVGTETSPMAQSGVDKYVTPVVLAAYVNGLLTGTANRITKTGTAFDIASNYVGQSSISTVGKITSGIWNAQFEARTVSFVSQATATIDTYAYDVALLSLDQAISIDMSPFITGPPVEGQELWVRWLDDGTPRAMTFDPTFFKFDNIPAPTTSIANQPGTALFRYNLIEDKFECVLNTDAAGGGVPALTATEIAFGDGGNLQTSDPNLAYASSALTVKRTTSGPSFNVGNDSFNLAGSAPVRVYDLGVIGSGRYLGLGYDGSQSCIWRSSDGVTIDGNGSNYGLTINGNGLIVLGTSIYRNSICISTTPSIAAGAGAGTGPTISIAGTNESGVITLTTGSTPTTGGKICDVTMSGSFAFPTKCVAVVNVVDDNASGLALIKTTGTSTVFTLTAPTLVTLLASTTYTWNYINKGY